MLALKNKISFALRRNGPKTESEPVSELVHPPRPVDIRNLDSAIDQTLERFPKTLEKLAA